jgi:Bacterial archaeo-eukaryotic release factor family 7
MCWTTGRLPAKEDKDEYLAHFYKQIDRGLNEILRGKTEPVVPVGVEYELALYRSVNTYPHLAEEVVHGAPNSLKAGEMHALSMRFRGNTTRKWKMRSPSTTTKLAAARRTG